MSSELVGRATGLTVVESQIGRVAAIVKQESVPIKRRGIDRTYAMTLIAVSLVGECCRFEAHTEKWQILRDGSRNLISRCMAGEWCGSSWWEGSTLGEHLFADATTNANTMTADERYGLEGTEVKGYVEHMQALVPGEDVFSPQSSAAAIHARTILENHRLSTNTSRLWP